MNFLIDDQLPPALARFLQSELKCPAIHVVMSGCKTLGCGSLALCLRRTFDPVLKDEDFANMFLQVPTAKLIWVRIGNCRKTLLLDLFRQMWPRILQRLESGNHGIEIR